ncbi:ester cyclase [Symbioplanes lichenis]|uniref:ester cyclase n=1 Tax=Symbioplanes lichenis TaxID=1629072 RepID=UPI002739C67E|nr:ester cyclase [Actinoplanes lichenis]
MSVKENKDLLVSFVKEVLDGKNADAAGKYLSPNFFHHDLAPGEQTGNQTGAAGQVNFFTGVVFPAFTGFTTTVEDVIGEGDLVAARWRQASTNNGAWQGRPATGKRTEIAGISVVRVRDGLIVEEWESRDAVTLVRQLGVAVPRLTLTPVRIPAPRPTPAPGPFLANGPLVAEAEDTAAIKAQAASVYMDAWNRGDLTALANTQATSFVLHDPTALQPATRAGSAALISAFRTGLPDLSVTVDLQLAEADKVVTRFTIRGTHKASLLGIAATGNLVQATGVSIQRYSGGKLAEEWQLWDQLGLAAQLGAVRI